MSSELCSAFEEYYRYPCYETVDILFDCIDRDPMDDWDNLQENLYRLWADATTCIRQCKEIRTNGSTTGIPSKKNYGPFFNKWFAKFECQHVFNNRPIITINSRISRSHTHIVNENQWFLENNFWRNSCTFWSDIHFKESQSCLLSIIEEINHEYQCKSFLMANPSVLRFILYGKMGWEEWLSENYSVHLEGVVSTGFCAFLPRKKMNSKIWINDRMIDWSRSCIFYTCPFNRIHFLPTSLIREGSQIDLINIADKELYPVADYWKLHSEQKEMCQCGKYHYPFIFIPHIKNAIRRGDDVVYDLSLIDKMEGCYYYFQFLQVGDRILAFYCPYDQEGVHNDIDMVYQFWLERGFSRVEFTENRFFQVRQKEPVFWKSDKDISQPFFRVGNPNYQFHRIVTNKKTEGLQKVSQYQISSKPSSTT